MLQAFTGVFKFQVMSEGGPQPQSIIHFSISNQTVAVVNRRGQVTGKVVGKAVVHGTIQTVNEDTGKVIVFSQVLVLCSALLLLFHLGIILGNGGGWGSDEEGVSCPGKCLIPSFGIVLTRHRKYVIFSEKPTEYLALLQDRVPILKELL